MNRRLLNLLTVLSLLLCAAVVALWVRSYWRMDQVFFGRDGKLACVDSTRGRVPWRNVATPLPEHRAGGKARSFA